MCITPRKLRGNTRDVERAKIIIKCTLNFINICTTIKIKPNCKERETLLFDVAHI